jgi:hypothetical protein
METLFFVPPPQSPPSRPNNSGGVYTILGSLKQVAAVADGLVDLMQTNRLSNLRMVYFHAGFSRLARKSHSCHSFVMFFIALSTSFWRNHFCTVPGEFAPRRTQ